MNLRSVVLISVVVALGIGARPRANQPEQKQSACHPQLQVAYRTIRLSRSRLFAATCERDEPIAASAPSIEAAPTK